MKRCTSRCRSCSRPARSSRSPRSSSGRVPDVERLLESTINSSYPSGHVAAATVYAAVAVIVFRHTSNRLARTMAVLVVTAIVLSVAWARLYQGMHFLSDVVAGIVLGATSLFITDRVLRSAVVRLHLAPRPGLGVEAQPEPNAA